MMRTIPPFLIRKRRDALRFSPCGQFNAPPFQASQYCPSQCECRSGRLSAPPFYVDVDRGAANRPKGSGTRPNGRRDNEKKPSVDQTIWNPSEQKPTKLPSASATITDGYRYRSGSRFLDWFPISLGRGGTPCDSRLLAPRR